MLHHEDAIAAFTAAVTDEQLAIIVTGSVARGTERADSDVDLYVVVDDAALEAARAERRVMYTSTDGIDYDGGYFDVKLVSESLLRDAALRADDATRASFEGARVVFSRLDGLDGLIRGIRNVPVETWDAHLASFLAQVRLHGGYFLPQAHEAGNVFLLHSAAVHLAGAASRALLAHNRVLYAGPKYLEKTVASLPLKPAGFAEAITALLTDPAPATANAVTALLEGFRDWPLPREDTLSTFVLDNELAWHYGTVPPEYS